MRFYLMARAGLAAAMLAVAGCARGGESPVASSPAPVVAKGTDMKDAKAFFPMTVGGKSLRVQVVVNDAEMQHGLMGRRDLGADDGMIFVYPAPRRLDFWMKDTPTPLDIGFFTPDGKLGEVYPLYPYDKTTVSSAASDYTLALEVNQGWFAKNGLKPGARLDLGQLAAALAARGFEPRRYGVEVK